MSINKPIIDAGPTVSRAEAKVVVGKIVPVAPPDQYIEVVDGNMVPVTQEAIREGQFVFVQTSGELSVAMYIVVKGLNPGNLAIDVLEWKRVYSAGLIVDPRTGKDKDPLFGLY
jgi:hypothetical protein